MKTKNKAKRSLVEWQDLLRHNQDKYNASLKKMDERENLYAGTKKIKGVAGTTVTNVKSATHVRNVVAELVEAQINSAIPQPKVTAKRQQDETKAKLIEDMIRNELDRLPFEMMNDMQERTCIIQGGSLFLVEWDHTAGGVGQIGDITVTDLHPKKVIPQDGVFSDIEDMDYIFITVPQTKQYIKHRYGIDVSWERESNPEIKGAGYDDYADDLVTQNIAYYRNDNGGIGLFSWVNDTVLEDLEDYQMRRIKRCDKCGMVVTGEKCSYCGSKKLTQREEAFEEVLEDIEKSDGERIPAFSVMKDENGFPVSETVRDAFGNAVQRPVEESTKIPYYTPGIYPIVLRKNVSLFGQFMGDSDVDKIADQQNTIKKLSTKINEKLLKGGSYVTMPAGAAFDKSDRELKIINLTNPADKQMIDVYNIQPDISGDMAYMAQIYEEARQTIGITDSFQGRRDATATSGKAKEFAAAQSAGRLESKKIMKDAAYARLFEIIFKFKLAYADEPRPVVSTDNQGNVKYEMFNRYDFLEQDESGEWYWNDQFLFSCDASATLANNREAMWQETRMNYQQGAFGDPASLDTLILFWTKMEQLHYPGAGDTRTWFEQKLQEQKLMQQQQMIQQQMMQTAGMPAGMVQDRTSAQSIPEGTGGP